MRRRDFVLHLPVLRSGLLLGGAALSLASCGGVRYVAPGRGPGRLSIARAELDRDGQLFAQAPDMDRPVYVRRLESGEVVALLASCTHQGCQPEPVADRLACPCHGSEFSLEGLVLQGPAERPLTRYSVTVEGDDLIVRLDGGGAG